jgi:YD repeat-containing protein
VPANNEVSGYTPRESLTSATGPYGSLAFTYDGVGNRVTATANPGSGLVTDTYSYPATSNRLTAIAQGSGGTRAFTYDAAGNVTFDNRTGGGYGYTYDAAGRMASLTINGVLQAEYKYDFAGRQAVRRRPQLGVTLHSAFDALVVGRASARHPFHMPNHPPTSDKRTYVNHTFRRRAAYVIFPTFSAPYTPYPRNSALMRTGPTAPFNFAR